MPIRERVLAMGPWDSGKSHQWLMMAKRLMPAGVQFYAIDTDDAIAYMMHEKEAFRELNAENGGNVHLYSVGEWPDYMDAQRKIKPQVKPGDWVVVDMVETPWKRVSDYYILDVHDETKGQYLLEVRKKMLAKGDKTPGGKEAQLASEAIKGRKDWPIINALYDEFISPIVYTWPCNVYAATRAEELSREEDPELPHFFREAGLKPAGQKNLGHQFHTIFLMTHSIGTKSRPRGEWFITTLRERADREYFHHAPLVDLYLQYFVNVVGWDIP